MRDDIAMSNPQKPEYVDSDFFETWQNINDVKEGETKEFYAYREVCDLMFSRIIFDDGARQAWRKLSKHKDAYMTEFNRWRYNSEDYAYYYEDLEKELQEGEYSWRQHGSYEARIPLSGDRCDIDSQSWDHWLGEAVDSKEHYYRLVIKPLVEAVFECSSLIHSSDKEAAPEILLKKSERVRSAVIEMRESLKDLGGTAQFHDFYRTAIRMDLLKFAPHGLLKQNKHKARDFQDFLDLWERVADGYSEALDGKVNSGLKPRPYLIRSILKVFLDVFDKPLLEITAGFVSAALDVEVRSSEVSRAKGSANFKEFTPFLKYSSRVRWPEDWGS